MGALALNRKRADEFPTLSNYSHSPHSRFSKRPRYSVSSTPDRKSVVSSKSVASRLARYPSEFAPLRREVHAPCRNSKFGVWNLKGMGNALGRRYEKAKSAAIGSLQHVWSEREAIDVDRIVEREVIDVDMEIEREVIDVDMEIERNKRVNEGGSSVEEIVNEGDRFLGDEKVVAGSSISGLTEDGMRVDDAGKMIDALSLGGDGSVSAYKKLYEEVTRKYARLDGLEFEIEVNEKKRSFYESVRTEKQQLFKEVEVEVEEEEEEIPREPFVDLTEEEENLVNLAFSANRRKVLVTHESSNIEITGEIMRCLHPRAWLNDEVINLYMELLKEREKREPEKYLKCHFFNTFFYKKLISGKGGYDYKSVRRWTTQRKLGYMLKDCEKIFVPIHKEIHWCLAIINMKEEKIQYLDSLGGRDTRVLKVLARYFVDEVKDKSSEVIDIGSWKQEFVEDLPEQHNGFDCGMFMIKYADFYSRGLNLCFDQTHMPYFRRRTAKEILNLRAE